MPGGDARAMRVSAHRQSLLAECTRTSLEAVRQDCPGHHPLAVSAFPSLHFLPCIAWMKSIELVPLSEKGTHVKGKDSLQALL